MKGAIVVAATAAMAGSANAVNHGHAHQVFAHKRNTDLCSTWVTTIWEETVYTLTPTQAPEPSTTPAVVSSNSPVTTSSAAPVSPTSTVKLPVPTPEPITYATPGTYTVPATTVTVSETTTVCGASSTHVVPGTHTVGGVTTIVETATTITCPVATATTNNGVVTSIITSTEYVCPSAGTYTVAPITTTVTEECDIHFPVPTSYAPGTYTIPQQVVTVTETNYVYYCPYTSSGLPTSSVIPVTLSPTKPIEALKPTTASPASQSEAPKSEASKSSDSPKPTSSSTPNTSKPPSGGFDGSFGGKGNHYGITYTPYYGESGDCKDATQVKKDLQEIKNDGFNVIRVYGTDCNALETIGPACEEWYSHYSRRLRQGRQLQLRVQGNQGPGRRNCQLEASWSRRPHGHW
ncbi:hypothetical protein V2G26_000729 [Clonostachys chloroleuca]